VPIPEGVSKPIPKGVSKPIPEGVSAAIPAGAADQGGALAGNGMAGDGIAGDGMARDGMAGDGMAGDGMAGEGMAGDGMAGDGLAGDGMAGDGMAGNGMAGDGMAGNGMAGDGEGGEEGGAVRARRFAAATSRRSLALPETESILVQARALIARSSQVGLYKISFTSSRLCTNQSCFHSSRPPALLTLLQYYCTAIGQYTTPQLTSRVYAIHYIILVITILCKCQFAGETLGPADGDARYYFF